LSGIFRDETIKGCPSEKALIKPMCLDWREVDLESRWLSQANIAARIKELRDKAEEECNITRRELMDFYVEVIETPAGQSTSTAGFAKRAKTS
jgi:hypothetical protein